VKEIIGKREGRREREGDRDRDKNREMCQKKRNIKIG
jgi:hypothetical protein